MKRSKNTGPTQRQLRVGEQLKHIVAETLQRCAFSHEALQGVMVTVTEVRPSPDLRKATAYVGCFGGDYDMEEIVEALNGETREIQREISRQSTSKFTPKIHFKADTVLESSARIHELLNEVHLPADEE